MRQISPEQIKLLNSLSALQISCGRPSTSLALLELSHKLNPHEPQTLYLLANAHLRLQEYEDSEKYFNLFEKTKNKKVPPQSLIMKSIILLKNGNLIEAKETFLSALGQIKETASIY